jgi:hypothetical protein
LIHFAKKLLLFPANGKTPRRGGIACLCKYARRRTDNQKFMWENTVLLQSRFKASVETPPGVPER